MKNILSTLSLVLTFGCSTYSAGDLNGKWAIKDEPIEMWILDTLAIGFQFENQFLNLYKVDYNSNILTFTNIEP